MDLLSLDAGRVDHAKMFVRDPRDPQGQTILKREDNGEDLYILLRHQDHPAVQSLWKAKLNEAFKAAQDVKAGKAKAKVEDDDGDIEFMVPAFAGWNFDDLGGVKDPECSPTNVRKALAARYLRDQVEAFYRLRANFLPPLPQT